VELLAEGRTAEVYAYGEGRVLKLDRPEWTGLAPWEGEILESLAAAGLPVARPHGAVTVEGRTGVVLDRVDGRSLQEALADATVAEAVAMAERFAELQHTVNGTTVEGLPALVPRLAVELLGIPDPGQRAELGALLSELDDGGRGVCHYDFHPDNVLVGPDGWVIIDWLTVAAGPPAADLARTLVLRGRRSTEPVATFMRTVRRVGAERHGLAEERLDAWVRVVAAARLAAEGFDGDEAKWLARVAGGSVRLAG
jgi:Ser/Thr protein kinase RdoA (MazF antagonist)